MASEDLDDILDSSSGEGISTEERKLEVSKDLYDLGEANVSRKSSLDKLEVVIESGEVALEHSSSRR